MKKLILINLLVCFITAIQAVTINVPTVGSLSTLISVDSRDTITNLALTGTIDARDFKFLRNSMPLLKSLNISGVTIAAYTGDEGTSMSFFYNSYLANQIPRNAFSSNTVLSAIVLPNSITTIGVAGFSNCTGLKSINLPTSLTSIGASAFSECSGLRTISIPESVTSIEESAFSSCRYLQSIYSYATVPVNLSTSSNVFSTIFDCVLFVPATSVAAYRAASKWGDFKFILDMNTPTAKSINITNAGILKTELTAVEKRILKELTISGSIDARDICLMRDSMPMLSVIDMGQSTIQAFSGVGGTKFWETTYDYPPNQMPVNSFLGKYQSKTSLTKIVLPSSLISIGNFAFYGCTGLQSIVTSAVVPIDLSSSSYVFGSVNVESCVLYVPAGSISQYKEADQWKDFTNIISIATGILEFKLNSMNIYPNPIKDVFQISDFDGTGVLSVLDISGKLVLKTEIIADDVVSIKTLPNGIYIIKLLTENGTSERKVLKN